MILAVNLKDDDRCSILCGFATLGVAMAWLRREYGVAYITKEHATGAPLCIEGTQVCKLVCQPMCDCCGRPLSGQPRPLPYRKPRY